METKTGERTKLVKITRQTAVSSTVRQQIVNSVVLFYCTAKHLIKKYAIKIWRKLYIFRDSQLFFLLFEIIFSSLFFPCCVLQMPMRFTTRISKYFYQNSL